MHRRISMVVAVAMILAAGGCSKKKSSTSSKDAALEGLPSKLTVRLDEAGSGEKRTLRYKMPAGLKQAVVMDMRMGMALRFGARTIPEIRMPVMRFHMALEITKVHPSGDMEMKFAVTELEVVSREGVQDRLLGQLKRQLKVLEGLRGTLVLGNRGETKNMKMVIPPGVPPQVRQTMESFQQQMHQLTPPLPEAPVGVGAKWTARMPISSPAFKAGQEATYELTALQPDSAQMKVTLRQWAPAQKIKAPGLPSTATAKLKKLTSRGGGSFKTFFARPVSYAQMKMDMEMSMHIKAGAQDQDMDMTMKLAVDVKPK